MAILKRLARHPGANGPLPVFFDLNAVQSCNTKAYSSLTQIGLAASL